MVSASHPPAMYPAAAVHPSAPIAANVTSLGWLPAVPFRWGFAVHRASLHLRFIGYCRSKQTMEHQPPPGSVKLPTCDLAWVTGSEKSLTCRKHLMPRWTWVGSSSQGWSALQLPGQGWKKKTGSFHWYLVPSWNLSIAPSTPLETDMYAWYVMCYMLIYAAVGSTRPNNWTSSFPHAGTQKREIDRQISSNEYVNILSTCIVFHQLASLTGRMACVSSWPCYTLDSFCTASFRLFCNTLGRAFDAHTACARGIQPDGRWGGNLFLTLAVKTVSCIKANVRSFSVNDVLGKRSWQVFATFPSRSLKDVDLLWPLSEAPDSLSNKS